jgi:hypothetical protein
MVPTQHVDEALQLRLERGDVVASGERGVDVAARIGQDAAAAACCAVADLLQDVAAGGKSVCQSSAPSEVAELGR